MFDLILDSSFPKSDGCIADSFHAYDNRKKKKKKSTEMLIAV